MAAAAAERQIRIAYCEWCVKAAEIVLSSRVDEPAGAKPPGGGSTSFCLKVPELFGVRSEPIAKPEFFDKSSSAFQVEVCGGSAQQLLERWTFAFAPHKAPDRSNQTLVRKLSVSLRSLLCFTRLLPTAVRDPSRTRHWRCRVEAGPPTGAETTSQHFVSLPSSIGSLTLSVSYRTDSPRPVSLGCASGSQMDRMEVEEGYVEPAEGKAAPAARAFRRGGSDVSECGSTVSASSARPSDHVVMFSSPPFAAAAGSTPPQGLSLGPSQTSSRSATPHSTPTMRPSKCSSGRIDDLSDIWMSSPPLRPRGSSFGSSPRVSRSPSPSPDIFLAGMSDDETDSESSSGGENVVATTLQSEGPGAFVFSVPPKLLDDEVVQEAANTESTGSPRLLSPLLAQLNPFLSRVQEIQLPPPAAATSAAAAERRPEPATDTSTHPLLVEMGELVCRLQQRQALTVTSREDSPEALMARLAHFREVADSEMMGR